MLVLMNSVRIFFGSRVDASFFRLEGEGRGGSYGYRVGDIGSGGFLLRMEVELGGCNKTGICSLGFLYFC